MVRLQLPQLRALVLRGALCGGAEPLLEGEQLPLTVCEHTQHTRSPPGQLVSWPYGPGGA